MEQVGNKIWRGTKIISKTNKCMLFLRHSKCYMKINQNERIENKDFFFQKTPKQQFEQGRSVYFFSPTKSCNLLLPVQLPYNQTPRTFCPLVLPSSYVACISWPFMAVSASPIMSAFQQEGRKERRREWPFLRKYFLEVAHITSIFIFLARSQPHSHKRG